MAIGLNAKASDTAEATARHGSVPDLVEDYTMTDERGDEIWLVRLKAAYEAGYYRTETAEDAQTPIPWRQHTCGDCPFWMHDICLVHETPRPANAHTCRFFDRAHRDEARAAIRRRRWELLRRLP